MRDLTVIEALVVGFVAGSLWATGCCWVAWRAIKKLLVNLEVARQFATPNVDGAPTLQGPQYGAAGAVANDRPPTRVMGRLRAMVGHGASATPDTEGAIDRKAMVARGVEELQAAAKAAGFSLSTKDAKEMAADMISESGV